ncbi:MAG: chemotaxis response regulator protein-glutamate methylesterase [Luteibacter sp.]|jgi:two-component system chemotaxis response regulator CheB|uniref:protein-glutamate methylesterase/protein-glutamine glutaminase n=1 Tax=Rhodanobacteraceae TaxID=1775411 RepID=UPI00056B352F|nr:MULTISPECIES: chemotaxis response regulator protein-glutamate methylesterase [Rhodanobacteraceae]MDQ7995171.1 chemotaxis response regulator protein-glutamate methylesterase [Luteibacter sp.]MDR6644165.1 two-component system chemotaxis response regulator CheB [Luteibacter sp. 1214]SDG74282.1 two-component system, chemotaxis family, response regulator CheB [Dyella sp. 333MFSha]SKB44535.1 two-component system, chemotaxis family, response regulator CheB [Luteibacter sp. 22Crub2.1]
MQKVRVLIVDDSALVRKVLSTMLESDPGIEVVGTAADPLIAREKIKQLNPDVLTLDVEMPRMDGLTFLENLMRLRPMPVVMVSTLTEKGADVTLRALELGAIDFFTKPSADLANTFMEHAPEICAKVRLAAGAKPRERSEVMQLDHPRHEPRHDAARLEVPPRLSADAVLPRAQTAGSRGGTRIIAIGASTGGTEAIRVVLAAMPPTAPPIVITQHIPAAFSGPFAARMDTCSAMRVCEARDGQPIQPGHAYIAPGSQHLLVMWDGARHVCRLHDGPPVNRHKPAVDVLFRSMAASVGAATIGVLLTGMGDDGARGLGELKEIGAPTLVQDEASSVVWGMPGAAWKAGAASEMLPLDAIAARLLALAQTPVSAAARVGT